MARYFMHLRDGSEELLDPEGVELLSLEDLRALALVAARDILAGDIRNGLMDLRFRIEAENEAGEVVYSLPFAHAVSIIPQDHTVQPLLAAQGSVE